MLKKHKVQKGERRRKCGVVSVMEEERKCCSSKEHRRSENTVHLLKKGGREGIQRERSIRDYRD